MNHLSIVLSVVLLVSCPVYTDCCSSWTVFLGAVNIFGDEGEDSSMATHRSVGAFEDGREEWTSYTERLEQYFEANDIKTSEKKHAILLSVGGAATYSKLSAIWQPRGGRRITALESWCRSCKLTTTLHHQWLYSNLLLTPVHRRIVQQYRNSWRRFDSCQSPVSLTPRLTICCRTDWCVAFAAMSRCNASFWPSQISHLRKPSSLASPQKQPRRMPGNYSRVQSPKDLRLWAIISRHDRRGLHHHPRVIDVMTSSIQPRTAASKLQNVTTAGRRATLWKFVAARTNGDSHIRGL